MASGRKLTTEEFIEKSNIKHNWKYDYSKTVYTIEKDKLKKQICKNNGVKLLYYSKFNKNIVL
jgi:hypothetical protein